MQQRSQRLTARHVGEGKGGGACNLAANFQSTHSLRWLHDSCDWSKHRRMQLQRKEALRLGWVFQNESQGSICCNKNSAVGQAPLLKQGFPWGEPQEWPSLMEAKDNYWAIQQMPHTLYQKRSLDSKEPTDQCQHAARQQGNTKRSWKPSCES